jgi:aminoglycoside phosphotransferase
MHDNPDLRQLLNDYFNAYEMIPQSGGASQATLFRVLTGQGEYILKAQAITATHNRLDRERKNYLWLSGKMPVPRLIAYRNASGIEMLCMEKVPGHTLEACIGNWSAEQLVRRFAETLKRLHGLPLDDAAPVYSLEERLALARNRLDQGCVETDDLDTHHRSATPMQFYDRLLASIPEPGAFVFTHGDCCFDNLLFEGTELSGLIDVGGGGVCDSYQDLAIAIRSVRDAFGESFTGLFFQAYGLAEPDFNRLDFYALLDEFF